MERLSNHLITNILDQVPNESLIPSRCVSKSWRHMVDSRFELPFGRALRLYLFPTVSSRLYRIDLRPRGDMVEIENPLGWVRFVLLGSCYSLICICNCGDGQLAIWKVPTGEYALLPSADTEIPQSTSLSVYGFGYDHENSECVLLRVVQTLGRPIVSEVSIYRSTINTWRRLQEMPYTLIEPGRMGVFVRGRLYWIMRRQGVRNSAKVLVAFDIHTESFVELDLPNGIDNRLRMDLAVPEEHLCLTVYGKPGVVDVWIMTKYYQGDLLISRCENSNYPWDRLFSLRDHWWSFRPIRPVALDGRRVLVEVGDQTKSLGCYNLYTDEVEQFQLNGMPRSFDEAICLSFDKVKCPYLRSKGLYYKY